MNISMKKISVLYKKDLKDLFRNMTVLVTSMIPLFFALFYRVLFSGRIPGDYLLRMMLALNLCIIAIMIPSTSIAEEKEKNTLRTLILSNVRSGEIFIAKVLVAGTLTLISNTLLFLIMDEKITYLPAYILITTAGSVPLLLLGAVTGLFARDQMTAGVYQAPLMLVFMLPAIFGNVNNVLRKFAAITPCDPVLKLLSNLMEHSLFTLDSLLRLGIIALWIAISTALFLYLMKKRGVDN